MRTLSPDAGAARVATVKVSASPRSGCAVTATRAPANCTRRAVAGCRRRASPRRGGARRRRHRRSRRQARPVRPTGCARFRRAPSPARGPKPRNSAVQASTGRCQAAAGVSICTMCPARIIATPGGDRERFVLVMRDIERGQARLVEQPAQFVEQTSAPQPISAPSGSSSIKRRGSTANARASATRCCFATGQRSHPPGSRNALRPTRSSASSTRRERSVWRDMRNPNSTLPATSRCGNGGFFLEHQPKAALVRHNRTWSTPSR